MKVNNEEVRMKNWKRARGARRGARGRMQTRGVRILPDWQQARGTNLKFQIGDFGGWKAPDYWCLRKCLIFRRLGPICTFFDPFLSWKSLISRRLQEFQGKISHEGRRRRAARFGPGPPGWSRVVPGSIFFNAKARDAEAQRGERI
jgi:hypothetical protein